MTSRRFHLGDILSITTGRLVSPRHIDGVYDILGFMTGEDLFTHQLPRASRQCAGPLLVQLPQLAAVEVPDEFEGKEHVERWLAEQVRTYGETLEVEPLVLRNPVDPIVELATMLRPDQEMIVVNASGTAHE